MSVEVSFVDISNATFRTTSEADTANQSFMNRLGLQERYGPARLAIARSLSEVTTPPVMEDSTLGKTIAGHILFGADLTTWVSLLVEHQAAPLASVKEVQSRVRDHWHRGISLLENDWRQCDGDFDEFVLKVASRAGLPQGNGQQGESATADGSQLEEFLRAGPISLRIGDPGTDLATKRPVDWVSNASGYAPHVAVMGGTNSGKTHSTLGLLRQLEKKAKCPILFFDIAKGDISQKTELIQPLNLQHVQVPAQPIPLDFLSYNPEAGEIASDVALAFRDTFERVEKLGGNQRDVLREAVTRVLGREQHVAFQQIRDEVLQLCAEREMQAGKLESVLNDLCAGRPLFTPTLSMQEFFSKSWLIDLHRSSETQQRLSVFLVLDAAKRYFMQLPDAPADAAGHRAYRAVIAIDEARRVLGFKHASLSDLVRLVRSKGVAIWLMSQSPDDFDAEEDNFLENIGLAISFRTNAVKPKALRAVLGNNIELSTLPAGVAVTRLPGERNFVKVQAWEPH